MIGLMTVLTGCSQARSETRDRPVIMIGVWQQPVEKISEHSLDGINTFVSLPSGSDRSAWLSALAKAGLGIVVEPPSSAKEIRTDLSTFDIDAYLMPDEPDLRSDSRQKLSTAFRMVRSEAPMTPTMVNFSGAVLANIQPDDAGRQLSGVEYINLATYGDILSQGLYPIAGWNRPDWISLLEESPTKATIALSRLATLKPDATRVAIIETGNQNLPWLNGEQPSPRSEQIIGQVWDAIINGAQAIVYFTISLDPFSWDSRTPEAKQAVREANDSLVRYGQYIRGSRSRVSYTAPFESARFTKSDGTILEISLNMSPDIATKDGQQFAPYEVRFSEG